MLDYSRFPEELEANVDSRFGSVCCRSDAVLPRGQVVLEPKLELAYIILNGTRSSARLIFTPTGDANNDGKVSFDDFLILSNGFGAEGEWDDGDFDFDGVVGFSDFLGLSANFGQSSNAATPEPSTGLLAAFGILGLLSLRRRR